MVSSWHLAPAGYPVVAGVLCVMAIIFNICAVSQGWREIIDPDGSATIIDQPAWAVALKAVSLASAVVAYIVLLFTMMSKRDPVKGFVITVLCWCVSAAMLFVIIGIIAGGHPSFAAQTTLQYTQNFFYGIFAAGLYILIAVLLGIYARNMHSIHLTHEERRVCENTSIILRATAFGAFLIGGAAVYSTVEGWSFMDALYWADYTLLTVGIGNIVPNTHLGRSLLYPYASAGIMTIGLVISSITSFTENMRELRIKIKMEGVHSGLHRRQIINDSPVDSRNDRESPLIQLPANPWYPNKADLRKAQRIKRDFYRRRRWMTLILSVTAWFFLWLVSAAIFRRSERSQNWTYFESLYFTYTSLTTIGYGDLYPTSNFGKTYFVFWSLLAIPVLTKLVGAMTELGFKKVTCLFLYLKDLAASSLCLRRSTQGRLKQEATSEAWRKMSVTDPESQGPVNNSNNLGRVPANVRRISNDIQGISSTFYKNDCCEPLVQAAQRSLLLGEEIGKLISILQSASATQIDLLGEWNKILSMLHPESDEERDSWEIASAATTSAATSHDHAHIETESLRSNRPDTDRNKEILWMLKFLADKVCSQLREGLHRDQSQMLNTLS
ncbi:putative ion channel [Penicillium brasilianum]|uniref:Putative ion channel n=1 Tax=Penicillium brasilianum TaxID=104259 RepID=A0A1S9RF39_PENBI|nr:putative ion channel [Penicillium brasilianum]